MLADMGWQARWKPGPGTAFSKKGLVILVTVIWALFCCVLSLKHANEVCSGGYSQADLDPKVAFPPPSSSASILVNKEQPWN